MKWGGGAHYSNFFFNIFMPTLQEGYKMGRNEHLGDAPPQGQRLRPHEDRGAQDALRQVQRRGLRGRT